MHFVRGSSGTLGTEKMVSGTRSRLFFDEHIVPSMREWEASPLEPHKAMSLAVNLNQMADYFWYEYSSDPSKIFGAKNTGAFRDSLSASLPEFALVRDVADAHKHFRLSRSNRKVTGAEQATLGALRWDEAAWDEAKWDSPDEIVVTYDDGSKHSFERAVRRVYAKWLDLLS
jgi:hypothetical protein